MACCPVGRLRWRFMDVTGTACTESLLHQMGTPNISKGGGKSADPKGNVVVPTPCLCSSSPKWTESPQQRQALQSEGNQGRYRPTRQASNPDCLQVDYKSKCKYGKCRGIKDLKKQEKTETGIHLSRCSHIYFINCNL